MGFKLGDENRKVDYHTNKNRFDKDDASVPGVTVIRKDLDPGIDGEANDDGTIFISDSVVKDSAEERQILTHEMKHLTEMKIGKLKYNDDYLKYNGIEYPREKGFILYEGEWHPEGSKNFPWEQH